MNLNEREEVIISDLASAQKFKFMVHRNKGDWAAKSLPTLQTELEREVGELLEALKVFGETRGNKESVISECADVANYLAMIIEKVRK